MFETTQVRAPLHVEAATRMAVLRMLRARADKRNLGEIVEEALQAWLQKNACEDPAAAQAAARGYQWKSLFLPEGTCLRFEYRRQTYHAQVCGDAIVYRGRAYSPRQLLLHITGSVRNAWREFWLRCPGDDRWHLADTRRHILRRSPRGLHLRGADTVPPRADQGAAPAQGVPRPTRRSQDFGLSNYAFMSIPDNLARYDRMRSMLYRDDLVRADQPDLGQPQGAGGRIHAGRAGPRDRRFHAWQP
jgi:hypothetical protein